jgi:hypothetical protein
LHQPGAHDIAHSDHLRWESIAGSKAVHRSKSNHSMTGLGH